MLQLRLMCNRVNGECVPLPLPIGIDGIVGGGEKGERDGGRKCGREMGVREAAGRKG